MPHIDPKEACSSVIAHLPAIPAWPQLPKRSFLENMYVQFSQGFPGVVIEGERIYLDRSPGLDEQLEQIYTAYLEDNVDRYATSADYAAGLHALLSMGMERPLAIKGQVIGPISWGLTITDQDRRSIIYDEVLSDALGKYLRLKAAWQEKALRAISPDTIIFVDEPYFASIGSAFISLSPEQVSGLLEEVLRGISGLKGVHCCANADWSILLHTSLDILSFDAYNYADSLSLYPAEVKSFLERGGNIAWGIIPNQEEALARETVSSLGDRLEEAMAPFTRNGVRFSELIGQGLITPSCGLATLSPEAAAQALELLAELSLRIRKRYGR